MPRGCKRIEDVPHEFLKAIEHSEIILSWYENLQAKEIPPPWMWPFQDELDKWFEEIESIRKNESGSGSDETPEDMDDNEFASRFK